MLKRLVEAVVDLVYPPEPGEKPIPFWRKLVVLVLLVALVMYACLMAR